MIDRFGVRQNLELPLTGRWKFWCLLIYFLKWVKLGKQFRPKGFMK